MVGFLAVFLVVGSVEFLEFLGLLVVVYFLVLGFALFDLGPDIGLLGPGLLLGLVPHAFVEPVDTVGAVVAVIVAAAIVVGTVGAWVAGVVAGASVVVFVVVTVVVGEGTVVLDVVPGSLARAAWLGVAE